MRHFIEIVDPWNFFVSTAAILDAKKKYEGFVMWEEIARSLKSRILISVKEWDELIKAWWIYNSSIHPDTKEPMHFLFKMSGFVIVNTPILFGTLLTKPTPFNLMFWQWVNQSYNAGSSYVNRNASSKYTTNDLLLGYGAALLASISLAVGLNKIFSPITAQLSGAKRLIIGNSFVWVAVSAANAANILLMRNKEIREGITIQDEKGEEYGKSKIGGKTALA